MRATMDVQTQLQFQLHDYGGDERDTTTAKKFTFIPYGLKSDVSKEAVKVHVLHGRKRNRTQNQNRDQDRNVSTSVAHDQSRNRGCVFEWDSRARPKPKPKPNQGVKRQPQYGNAAKVARVVGGGDVVAETGVADVTGMPWGHRHMRYRYSHESALRKSVWDSQHLRNPFLESLRDGFGPVSSSRVDSANYLVDHYLSRCGSSKFPRELLACYWQDTASLKAFLAHAATLFSLETGLVPPVEVDELMYSALQEVRRRLSDPVQKYADGTSLAVAMLANAEEGRLHRETAECHWRGLKQLLRLRGEFSSLRQYRDLHTMLLWREIISSNSYNFCFGHGTDQEMPELQHCNEHLIAVFNIFADELAEGRHLERQSDDVQHFLGAIVNRNIIRYCDWTCSMKRRSEIACLVYLATIITSTPISVESRQMMESIKNEVIERDRWGQVTQEELLFIMLQKGDLDHEWRCQQLWQISRCNFMTRDLNERDWKTVRDLLSLYVGIEDGCNSKVEVLSAWNLLFRRLLREDGCHVELGECHVTGWAGIPKQEVFIQVTCEKGA